MPKNVGIPSSTIELTRKKLKQVLFLERFDYNNLPQALQNKADAAIAGLSSPSVEQLSNAIENYFNAGDYQNTTVYLERCNIYSR